MAEKRRTVVVSRDGIRALEEPRFLIHADGKLYLTVAVLEYDPNHPELKEEHKATIADLHQQLQAAPPVQAARMGPEVLTRDVIAANMVGPDGGGDGTGSGGG